MKKIIAFTLSVLFLFSCSTTNEVVTNSLFQKRKYKKGWHVNTQHNFPSSKDSKMTKEENFVTEESTVDRSEDKSKSIVYSQTTEYKINETDELEAVFVAKNRIVVKQKSTESKSRLEIFTKEIVNANRVDLNKIEAKSPFFLDSNTLSDENLLFILLVILCFVLPFVTVGIVAGWDSRDFLISLILFLCAAVFVNVLFLIGLLTGVLAVIHALLVLFELI